MNSKRIITASFCIMFSVFFVSACKQAPAEETAVTTEEKAPEAQSTYKEAPMIEPDEFEKGMDKNKSVLLDVRMPQEFEQGHIEGAVNINFFDPTFKSQLLALDKDKKYYMYCKNDSRSERAAEFMLQNDFPEVYVLKGGYEAWQTAGK